MRPVRRVAELRSSGVKMNSEKPLLTVKVKRLLIAPYVAAFIFHAWMRLDPAAGSKNALILPLLALFLFQAVAVPIGFAAAWKFRRLKGFAVILGASIGYLLVTLYSLLYALGGAVGAIM